MLPLFPLNMVVFPNESLNLHIFEPRYLQMVQDCVQNNGTFGIPVFLDKKVQEYGTELRVQEIAQRYEDDRLDIRTQALRIFRIDSFRNPMPDKLHAGGKVSFLETQDDADVVQRLQIQIKVKVLYEVLRIDHKIDFEGEFLAYRLAHHIGLSLAQELELLKMLSEIDRLQFIENHLDKTIPIIREMERTKERIRMNGHFRNFKPPLSF